MADDLFYRQAIFAARGQYQKLLAKRKELDAKRAQIETEMEQILQTVQGLAMLAKEKTPGGLSSVKPDDLTSLGLADACRKILGAEDRFMSPRLVRDSLVLRKYDLSAHKNPLASIHAILKRFEESGEAESLKMAGKAGYRLTRTAEDAVVAPSKKRISRKK